MASTFWITKYALTQGIFKAEGCELLGGYVCRSTCGHEDYLFVKLGTGAFETEAEAKLDAIKKADARLKSLDKERAKLLAARDGWKE